MKLTHMGDHDQPPELENLESSMKLATFEFWLLVPLYFH